MTSYKSNSKQGTGGVVEEATVNSFAGGGLTRSGLRAEPEAVVHLTTSTPSLPQQTVLCSETRYSTSNEIADILRRPVSAESQHKWVYEVVTTEQFYDLIRYTSDAAGGVTSQRTCRNSTSR